MTKLVAQYRSMPTATRLLLLNQFTINFGFYLLMPYLAQHLAGTLGLAAWLVGLILGVRNLSQQGMFAVGGALADRLGYKPLIVAGCVLRTAGFGLLALADSVPALVIASAATGLAGAMFNPAVRAYLALDSGSRRIEAFALFNVFYQAGILIGPVVGLLLTGASFRLTCAVSAAVFAVLSVIQIRALPRQPATTRGDTGLAGQWRVVLTNRRFLLFAAAMTCSSVLTFQVYLALPLEVRRIGGDTTGSTIGVALLFVASGLVTVLAQTKLTAWCRTRIPPGYAMAAGTATMAIAFLPLLATAPLTRPPNPLAAWALAILPALTAAILLAIGTMLTFPFEMDTIVTLAQNRLVATHYGIYNTICGLGITAGNLLTGATLDTARAQGLPTLPWLALVTLGALGATTLLTLHRTNRLTPTP
ncbi:MFS transporter [Kribbella sandramycini]|uniref:MFS family permease n=1 Tax=Kribbella sandramycini TaxID=60450 RepID=A0A7Y4KXK5_9ACTN|nr:MFS transporter [Kribbella sandramycini]MBB6569674.1 MFS family permease [Kribbella sandramycini]NOL40494.1 MFS transporter [Kribbella sandramycini]